MGLAVRMLWRADARRALAASLSAAALVWIVTFGHSLPGVRDLWLSPASPRRCCSAAACSDPLLVTTPYHEPSLVYLHGPYRTRLVPGPAEAAAVFRTAPCAAAVIGERERPGFLAALGEAVHAAAVIEGRNYSNGRQLRLTVFVRPQ